MMIDRNQRQGSGIELDLDLDDPPQKVWRALTVPGLRDRWLPRAALADPGAIILKPGREVRYRLRADGPPFLESTVTFTIAPNATGGTRLQIAHHLTKSRFGRSAMTISNLDEPLAPPMLAA